jgi:hypothetical protein
MPQNCQIIGANSVTNIDPRKGVLPLPFIKNADWFEKSAGPHAMTIASCLCAIPSGG